MSGNIKVKKVPLRKCVITNEQYPKMEMFRIVRTPENEVFIAREKFGTNEIKGQTRKTFIGRFIENLFDPIIKILLVALLVKVIFMFKDFNWFETVGILIAIFLVFYGKK